MTVDAAIAKLASCRIVFVDGDGVVFGNKGGSSCACCCSSDSDCERDCVVDVVSIDGVGANDDSAALSTLDVSVDSIICVRYVLMMIMRFSLLIEF